MRRSVVGLSVICLVIMLSASASFAGSVGFTNLTQSGTVSWDLLDSDTIRITVENTTEVTESAGDLLTAVWFNLPGVGSATLVKAEATPVSVDGSGIATIGSSMVNLLAIPKQGGSGGTQATWSMDGTLLSGLALKFQPDAEYGIIGPSTTNSSGQETYPDSNGGIRVSPGHNPFAYEKAIFDIDITGSFATVPIDVKAIVFGTDFQTVVVPLPAAAWAGFGLLGLLGAARRIRRRRVI